MISKQLRIITDVGKFFQGVSLMTAIALYPLCQN